MPSTRFQILAVAGALATAGSACDGGMHIGASDPEIVPPGLTVAAELSAESLQAGDMLTVTMTATNVGTIEPLHGVEVMLPVATESLALLAPWTHEGGEQASPPSFDERNNVFNWRIPVIQPGATIRHSVVLQAQGERTHTVYNGILAFARNEQGPLGDNGVMDGTAVLPHGGAEAAPVDLELTEWRPPRVASDEVGGIDLQYAITNKSTTETAHNVRVIGCLDPAADFPVVGGRLTPVVDEQRCYTVGFSTIEPQKFARVGFRSKLRDGLTEVPKKLFSSIFTTGHEPDPDLTNNWLVTTHDPAPAN